MSGPVVSVASAESSVTARPADTDSGAGTGSDVGTKPEDDQWT